MQQIYIFLIEFDEKIKLILLIKQNPIFVPMPQAIARLISRPACGREYPEQGGRLPFLPRPRKVSYCIFFQANNKVWRRNFSFMPRKKKFHRHVI